MIPPREIRFALSIRQPWAWLIVNAWKDVENRDWPTLIRGPVFIHTGKVMKPEDYDECYFFVEKIAPEIRLPLPQELPLGGIVGVARLHECVYRSESRWFVGENGFVLRDRQPCDFIPCKGEQGFFRPKFADGNLIKREDLRFLKEAA